MGTRANDFALLEKELELFFFLLVQVTKIPKKQLFDKGFVSFYDFLGFYFTESTQKFNHIQVLIFHWGKKAQLL